MFSQGNFSHPASPATVVASVVRVQVVEVVDEDADPHPPDLDMIIINTEFSKRAGRERPHVTLWIILAGEVRRDSRGEVRAQDGARVRPRTSRPKG